MPCTSPKKKDTMEFEDTIAMLPSGLLAGFMEEQEISIGDLTVEGFRFRTAEKCVIPASFRLLFYDLKAAEYREIRVTEFTVKEQKNQFFYVYQIVTEQKDYQEEVARFMVQYSQYVRLKTEEDDSILAETLTGYPAAGDLKYGNSLEEQKRSWFSNMNGIKDSSCIWEIALELDRKSLYNEYLQKDMDSFLKDYRISNHLPEWIWKKYRPERLYIGNQFCHLLFPEENTLFAILEKAVRESMKVTVSFSYIREYMLENIRYLLQKLDRWAGKKAVSLEVVINDWGMAELVKEYTENLIPCLGILLNKQRKDPRIKYKKGDLSLLGQNNIHADFYRSYLQKQYKINRYEWETCGYISAFPEEKNSLHIPFYQTNTSQYCPLYASLVNGNRANQNLIKKCPGYCEKYTFLYPEHLEMTGRYNSLFALDREALRDSNRLNAYRKAGADRLVMNFL